MKNKPFAYCNNSDIGYMDEEWINYIPELKEEKEEIKKELNEEQAEEVQ